VQEFVIVESIASLLTLLFWTSLKLWNENLVLFYYVAFWSCGCDTVRKLMHQTTQQVNKHWHGGKGWEKESNTVKGAR
jgi:hypothetical protein